MAGCEGNRGMDVNDDDEVMSRFRTDFIAT